MPNLSRIEDALNKARDFESFAQGLLHGVLGWPIPDEAAKPFEVGYEWSENEVGTDRTAYKARAYELMLLPRDRQPHGIFLLEFHDAKVFDTRGFATPLRAVLRRLVAGQRKEAHLPSWKLDNILFICTHNYRQYAFAMFRDTFKTGKVNEARLATFGWNRGESCRTAIQHNLPGLEWPSAEEDRAAWVNAWAEAFNKEPLTRRFFKQFDSVLELIKADLEKLGTLPSADAYSRAQLLLERLIFLYFVQNRGWLDRNPNYLLEGFAPYRDKPDEFSYYERFLEPLFWSLSSPGHKAFSRNEAVPFLNGGLFNDDEFEPSPRRRKDNPALPIRNATFAKVFDDLLEAFNFTVREDTPLNQEVAVDPEMLGKVFESIVLHAEAADETASAPDKRKETGSFYTPRIVVHFICREALFQWLLPRLPSSPSPLRGEGKGEGGSWPARLRQLLSLDASDWFGREELETLKTLLSPEEASTLLELVTALRCCDPAVGSGAFMIGLLHELTNLRRLLQAAANGYVDPVRKDGAKWLHETKADVIQNNLFGVDIQQQAIEICMLRLWLSLVVDYDLGLDPFAADRKAFLAALREISQLPNLEMNFKRGDSLHDHICGVPVRIIPGKEHRYQKQFDAIHKLGAKLHEAKSWDYKRKLRLEILKHRLEVSELVIADELKLLRQEDSVLTGMFGETGSDADRRRRIAHEAGQLEEAQKGIRAAQKTRDRLENQPLEHNCQQKLRKLEGASFDAPFNFAWRIDFPQVFYPQKPVTARSLGDRGSLPVGGFDIFVGNPPFVTARQKDKRELWRERWQPYCHGKYHLLVPFFPLAADLLRPGGQLGYIVSNAFAKREFGKPLVERFLPTTDLQKVVDCSGLMFPGHGTPTCLVFIRNAKPVPGKPVINICTLPGGGDLGTEPEDSPLWQSISLYHMLADTEGELEGEAKTRGFRSTHEDNRLAVGACDRTRYLKHPCSWVHPEWPTLESTSAATQTRLRALLGCEVGFDLITGCDELFVQSHDTVRRLALLPSSLRPYSTGEDIRDWQTRSESIALFPYSDSQPVSYEALAAAVLLAPFKQVLQGRVYYGSKIEARGLLWWEYAIVLWQRRKTPLRIAYAQIATHGHWSVATCDTLFKEKAPVIKLPDAAGEEDYQLLTALLSSAVALFWLKQVCFSKRESEQPEKDTYYEFAGGKVEQLPVPERVAEALRGEWNQLARRLADLAQACWERGQALPRLAMKKLFEKPGEAYHDWNFSLPGYEKPHEVIGKPFRDGDSLKLAFDRAVAERERLRAEMIALQEEMDWLVYAAYGLLPEDHPAIGPWQSAPSPLKGEGWGEGVLEPLSREHRPFALWKQAEGDFSRAIGLIPTDCSARSRQLWRERLAAIRDSEHIRRIEQPVYKRRWDEQWKVKGRWECGPVAYAAELCDAFEWWLLEKAEWYLEHKRDGGPVELADWAAALWKDSRARAAVEFVASPSASPEGFERLLKNLVDAESVEDGIPFAKPWDKLPKSKYSGLAQARKIRGKLNVPRERFHKLDRTTYKWAGLMFR